MKLTDKRKRLNFRSYNMSKRKSKEFHKSMAA